MMTDELKTVLAEFFGGPWDGNRREVMARGFGYRVPLEGFPPTMGSPADAALPARTEIHVYVRRNRLSKGGYVVFEYEGTKR
jgi:hypothetical protein